MPGSPTRARIGSSVSAATSRRVTLRSCSPGSRRWRAKPWLVVGTGLILGIATARFLKASSTERYYRQQQGV